jgi:hypothetical protein
MRSRLRFVLGVAVGLSVGSSIYASSAALAFEQFDGIRALGMGGALRGAAAGGAGPLLNPSGMSLVESYSVEADYLYAATHNNQFFHGSIVDSTSGYKVAGGLYYTYHTDSPAGLSVGGHGHELGLALSVPVGDHVSVGGTLKYFRLSGDEQSSGENDNFTADAGVTIRPVKILAIGLVGTNLRNLHTDVAPRAVGYGVAFTPVPDLMLALDGVTNLDEVSSVGGADLATPRKGTRVMAGVELLLAKKIALRAGGGYDGVTQNGFFSAGFSAISEDGAFDVGVKQDAFQEGHQARQTMIGASLKLFVPQP